MHPGGGVDQRKMTPFLDTFWQIKERFSIPTVHSYPTTQSRKSGDGVIQGKARICPDLIICLYAGNVDSGFGQPSGTKQHENSNMKKFFYTQRF